tara:strand:+ start:1214 stop:1570 length:357 start_codon:yes stop_codon:yes gene_type:complete
MTKKISTPKSNGATVTPTVDPKSVARCGIPAPAPKGRNNIKLKLAKNAAELLEANPLPAQAQAILFVLDQLGGSAKQSELIEALDADESPLATVQGATRIVTFYRKKLLEVGFITTGV